MSNALLITNNTPRGRINAFDPKTGAFLGALRDASGKPIEIDDVWAIQFGQGGVAGSNGNPNQLFFTAGNNNYGIDASHAKKIFPLAFLSPACTQSILRFDADCTLKALLANIPMEWSRQSIPRPPHSPDDFFGRQNTQR
jgi:hypothetical protein